MSVKIRIPDFWAQKLSTNQIARFFNLVYLPNRLTICVNIWMMVHNHKKELRITIWGGHAKACPSLPKHARVCPILPKANLVAFFLLQMVYEVRKR